MLLLRPTAGQGQNFSKAGLAWFGPAKPGQVQARPEANLIVVKRGPATARPTQIIPRPGLAWPTATLKPPSVLSINKINPFQDNSSASNID